MKYKFNKPLIEGIITSRPNRFLMNVNINNITNLCHCPSTGRIGNIIFKDIPCLLSKSENKLRKTKYTVEAISLDPISKKYKSWIGINQSKANKYIKYFFENNLLPKIIKKPINIRSEVKVGNSRIDLLIDNKYIEIKTPLINLPTTKHTLKSKESKFNSFDRLIKHYDELSNNEGMLILCYMYDAERFKAPKLDDDNKIIHLAVKKAESKGVKNWQINFKIDKTGISLINYFKLKIF